MEGDRQLWELIPFSDFKLPAAPTTEAATSGLARVWQHLLSVLGRSADEAQEGDDEWRRPSDEVLAAISDGQQWAAATECLSQLLKAEADRRDLCGGSVHVVVEPPGIPLQTIIGNLGIRDGGVRLLPPPKREQLVGYQPGDVGKYLPSECDTTEWILVPQLSQWFVRHEDGLALVRDLLAALTQSPRPVLVGCNSWAWSFLCRAIGADAWLGEPWTFAPFDAERLDHWLRSQFAGSGYELRSREDDEPIFRPEAEPGQTASEARSGTTSATIRGLAAASRGIPGVALAVLQRCLRTRVDQPDGEQPADRRPPQQLWVTPLADAGLPRMPPDASREHRFILHAILIHGGLSLDWIKMLLPLSSGVIQRRVAALLRAGVIVHRDEQLWLHEAAYPLVHRDLRSEGFLADQP